MVGLWGVDLKFVSTNTPSVLRQNGRSITPKLDDEKTMAYLFDKLFSVVVMIAIILTIVEINQLIEQDM